MNLRPYQTKCLEAMAAAAARGVTRQLVVMATGLGKTVTMAAFHAARGHPRLFGLMHRDELLTQARQRFLDVSPALKIGIEKADLAAAPDDQVIMASVQTVGRSDGKRLGTVRPDWPGIVWVDEVHHAPSASYLNVLNHFGLYGEDPPNRSILAIGTTATPDRLDKLGYDKIFDDVVFRYGLREAIRDGWLADIHASRIHTGIDLSEVKVRGGDFAEAELDRMFNTREHNREVAQIWAGNRALLPGSRALFFCITKSHAHAVGAALVAAGARAHVVVDDTPPADRASAINALRAGEIDALVNVGVFTEGFDLPEINEIHIVRPTKSQGLYTQMIGRGTRKAPGKSALHLFDHVGHGHDICSIGRIFGLPDAWDIGGRSVSKDVEELEETVDALGISVDGLTGPEDLRAALRSKVRRMQIIQASLIGANIPSELFWIQPSKVEERYIISWRNETREQFDRMPMDRQVRAMDALEKGNLWGISERLEVFQNELGKYEAKIFRRKEGQTVVHPMGTEASLAKLVGHLEGWVSERRPHKVPLLDKSAKWGRQPASDKQGALLVKRGIPEDVVGELTKREASILIDMPSDRLRRLFREERP
jgi:superfamily II DNA or RNA helicase